MAALCNRADHYIFIMFLLSSFFFSSPNLSGQRLDVYTWCGLSANLECRSETCCARLAENTGRKKVAQNRHLGTIAKLCRAISSQLRHVSTIGKKHVKQQYVLHMSRVCAVAQYAVLEASGKVNGIGEISHPSPSQTLGPIWMPLQIYHCVLQGVDVQNLIKIDSAVAALRMREKCGFAWVFLFTYPSIDLSIYPSFITPIQATFLVRF